MKKLNTLLLLLAAGFCSYAASPDSLYSHKHHLLNEVEVLGLKQMPTSGSTPTTRITTAEINRLGIATLKDAGALAPNFFVPPYGSKMTSSVYMRGLGSRIDQAVVGLSVDGVPILNKDAYDFDMTDLSQIEVLRGAQSVLNGQNSMAGQINIHTLSPRDIQGWRGMVEYGKANTLRSSLGGYFKLTDKLYTSLSGYYNHTDGFWTNEQNGADVGVENSAGLRWKTVLTPSPWHSITNTFAFASTSQSGYPYASVETDKIAYNDTCFYKRNTFSDGLTVAWAGKRVVVTSLTSVQYIDDNMTLDQDFSPEDYFTLTQKRKEWTLTEDLFAKGIRGKYSWLLGVFGFIRNGDMQAPVTFFDTGIEQLIEANCPLPLRWTDREFLLMSDFDNRKRGAAVYHQSRYELGNWQFEAGLRWDIQTVESDYRSDAEADYMLFDTPNHIEIHDTGTLKQNFNELLPKLSITYNLPYGHVFASVSKGYKPGGINSQMFSDVLQQRVMQKIGLTMLYKVEDIVCYKPETSWDFEVGAKLSTNDGRLAAEAVAFFIDCRDQQLTVFPPGMITGRIMTNAGKTHSRGFEVSATYRPVSDFTLSASYGFTHATFDEYDNGKEDFAGKRVPYAPEHTLFASALWRIPFAVGPFIPSLNVSARGIGSIMWNEANTLSQPFYILPSASLTLQADGWSIKLWGENISNTKYNTFYFMSMGNEFVQHGRPISFGATLRINLNKN